MTFNATKGFAETGHTVEIQQISMTPRLLARLWREEEAQGLVEYVLVRADKPG